MAPDAAIMKSEGFSRYGLIPAGSIRHCLIEREVSSTTGPRFTWHRWVSNEGSYGGDCRGSEHSGVRNILESVRTVMSGTERTRRSDLYCFRLLHFMLMFQYCSFSSNKQIQYILRDRTNTRNAQNGDNPTALRSQSPIGQMCIRDRLKAAKRSSSL